MVQETTWLLLFCQGWASFASILPLQTALQGKWMSRGTWHLTHCKHPWLPSAHIRAGVVRTPTSASESVPCEANVDGAILTAESCDSSEWGPPCLILGIPLSVYEDPPPTVRRLSGAWTYISYAVQRLLLECRGKMNGPFPVPPSSWTSSLPGVPSHHPTAWQ